jgi:NTP pyrophosphatase (non-canonical NTP hydrolase)
MVMPILKEQPGLREFQEYVAQLEIERGFAHQEVIHKCLLLGEEVGELFKAVRKLEKLNIDQKSQVGAVSEELADILIYVCAIANRCNVDLEQAFRDKEQINNSRTWHQP